MTGDRITANLPSRDFDVTQTFYARLGFDCAYRADDWMILRRGPMQVEFFAHPEIDPMTTWFSASMRLADIDAMHSEWLALDLPTTGDTLPRISADTIKHAPHTPRMFFLHDPDGSLWRVMENI